jgi:hypothetical protein
MDTRFSEKKILTISFTLKIRQWDPLNYSNKVKMHQTAEEHNLQFRRHEQPQSHKPIINYNFFLPGCATVPGVWRYRRGLKFRWLIHHGFKQLPAKC